METEKFDVFGNRTAYGKELDSDIDRYKKSLDAFSKDQENVKTQLGAEQSAIIRKNNTGLKDNTEQYQKDIDKINEEYKASIADRRAQADELIANQKDAAGLEANIAAAKASEGGQLSVSQMSSINKDITNQFTASLNNALKDNINFQVELDSKLANMGFSVIDKKRVLDEFSKVLSDEETAPLLDAIASKYNTRSSFMTALSDTVKGLHQQQIKDSGASIQRSERLERDEAAFSAMSSEQKARDVRDRLGPTWNVLTPSQKQQLINDTVSGKQSYRETLDMIENLKDQQKVNVVERQQILASEGTDTIGSSGVNETSPGLLGTTTGDRNYTGKVIKKEAEVVAAPAKVTAESKYHIVGNYTYKDKASYEAAKRLIPSLKLLKTSDPAKYQTALKRIKEKYIIS